MDSTIFNDMNRFLLEVAFPETFRWLVFLSVVWIPFVLTPIAWHKFTKYTRKAWLLKQKHVVMEIKLPAETFKSPLYLCNVTFTSIFSCCMGCSTTSTTSRQQ